MTESGAEHVCRWQQGFDLSEVWRELGRLNESVVAELDDCAFVHPEMEHSVMPEARTIWAALYSVAFGSSISRHFELQRFEAAGHVADLEQGSAFVA